MLKLLPHFINLSFESLKLSLTFLELYVLAINDFISLLIFLLFLNSFFSNFIKLACHFVNYIKEFCFQSFVNLYHTVNWVGSSFFLFWGRLSCLMLYFCWFFERFLGFVWLLGSVLLTLKLVFLKIIATIIELLLHWLLINCFFCVYSFLMTCSSNIKGIVIFTHCSLFRYISSTCSPLIINCFCFRHLTSLSWWLVISIVLVSSRHNFWRTPHLC